jgi:hypothetical protein
MSPRLDGSSSIAGVVKRRGRPGWHTPYTQLRKEDTTVVVGSHVRRKPGKKTKTNKPSKKGLLARLWR